MLKYSPYFFAHSQNSSVRNVKCKKDCTRQHVERSPWGKRHKRKCYGNETSDRDRDRGEGGSEARFAGEKAADGVDARVLSFVLCIKKVAKVSTLSMIKIERTDRDSVQFFSP